MRTSSKLLAIAILVTVGNAAAQTTSTADESELGWQFSDCFYYYTFALEGMKSIRDSRGEATYTKMRNLSISAALTLIGEEKYKAEVNTKNAAILLKLRGKPTPADLGKLEDS